MPPLEERITDIWGQITAATHHFLELVAEFDETGGWADGGGIRSCAHWLNIFCGIGMGAAREKVRVAHSIRGLPKINAAFREGRVSYSKVRAMTRVATPENEHLLLNIAIHGTAAHIERTSHYYRKVERIEEASRAAAAHRDRYLSFRCGEDDEHMIIHGQLPIEVAELLSKAIDRAIDLAASDPQPTEAGDDVSAETSQEVEGAVPEDTYPVSARRVDAIRLIAEQFLAQQEQAAGSTSDRYQLVVHIDQQLLSGQASERPTLSEIEDGPALAVETARRLGCDGALVGIVDDAEGLPLNVGRKTRTLTPALRRALKARDKGCRFPGCPHWRFTEGHHIEHWANGGATRLSNLITLCHFHHHLVHEGGFRIERTDDGVFIFRKPNGGRLTEDFAVDRRFCGNALAESNRRRGIEVGPGTVRTRWLGERMDYSLAIDALLAARSSVRARREGATTPRRS